MEPLSSSTWQRYRQAVTLSWLEHCQSSTTLAQTVVSLIAKRLNRQITKAHSLAEQNARPNPSTLPNPGQLLNSLQNRKEHRIIIPHAPASRGPYNRIELCLQFGFQLWLVAKISQYLLLFDSGSAGLPPAAPL